MTALEFQPWPKIARLNRDITITEKLDGTNAAVVIVPIPGDEDPMFRPIDSFATAIVDGVYYAVFAQSRTRFITPENDNYGFASWVNRNADQLVATLGEGTHFGEWWGAGIQRGYGLTGSDKRFSLFNTARWATLDGRDALYYSGVIGLDVVPVLDEGPFGQEAIDEALDDLRTYGSAAAFGFDRPEGIVIFHHASREMYKITLEGDEAPKAQPRDEHGNAISQQKAA